MSMIGLTPNILGTEPKVPNFHGSADVVWDGKYLWISNRHNFGEPPKTTIAAGSNGQTLPQATINVVSASGFPTSGVIYVTTSAGIQAVNHTGTNFPTNTQFTGCTGGAGTMSTGGVIDITPGLNKLVWVVDPSSGIPRVIAKVDLNSYPGRVVRSLNVSNNGLYIYACLAGFPTAFGANPAEQCSCLVINKNTFQVVGNARVSNALIGGPSFVGGGRAVHAADDGADHLWVVNSNQSNGNAVERFSLATVLANGVSPTSSVQLVNVTQPHHAEELALGSDGYFYTSASDYTTGVSRIHASTGAISHAATTHQIWGPKFLAGALWGGDFGRNISRLNIAAFGTGSFETDYVALSPVLSGANNETLGAFAFDGTFVWSGGAYNNNQTSIAAGSNGQVLPQAVINVANTTAFPSSGALAINTGSGLQYVYYTGKTGTTFTGCTGGSAAMATNNSVFSRAIKVHKLSTTGGSVAIVATVVVYVPIDNGQGSFNLTFDGQYIWGVERVLSGICAMFKIDPTPGSEKVVMVWPNGGVFSQQT